MQFNSKQMDRKILESRAHALKIEWITRTTIEKSIACTCEENEGASNTYMASMPTAVVSIAKTASSKSASVASSATCKKTCSEIPFYNTFEGVVGWCDGAG